MPDYSFNFEGKASQNGVVELKSTYRLPVSATLKSLVFQTVDRCDSRANTTSISVVNAQGTIIDLPSESIEDCRPYQLPLQDIELKQGDYEIIISSAGFQPNESIRLSGKLSYSIFIFFGEIEGISEWAGSTKVLSQPRLAGATGAWWSAGIRSGERC